MRCARDTEPVTALVGRDAELAEIRRALADVRAGQGRLVLVGGPAGIGKTRIAAAAVEAATASGMEVAQSRAVDDPGAPALWPWSRLMHGWPGADALPVPETGEPDAAARFRLFSAIADLLIARAGTAGLVLVLEDMHWADRMSVLLLRHVAAELTGARIGVVITSRDGGSGPLLDATAELIRGEHTHVITLGGLSVEAVSGWLPELIGARDRELATALHARTGGNPLLVRLVAQDLARHNTRADPSAMDSLMTDRPELRRLVAARVAHLSDAARAVVQAASVLGERVVPDLVAAVAGRPGPDIDPLLGAAVTEGILRHGGPEGGLRFEHALVRDAIYAEIPPGHRAELHRRCALALADLDAGLAGVIAMHWQRADGVQAVAQCRVWAERADAQARRRLAWDDATRYAELALTSARRVDAPPAEQARLLIRVAEVRFLASAVPASLQACTEAADLAEAAGRPDLIAEAGLVVQGIGDYRAYRTISGICERALAALPAEAHALRARLHAQLAVGVAESEGGARSADVAAEALAEAERSGDPVAILEAIAARHLAISVPHQVAERLDLGRRAVELGASSQRPIAALWGHLWRTDAALQLGNLAVAEQELTEIEDIADRRGSALATWHVHRFRAVLAALSGDFDAARAANAAARELALRCEDHGMASLSSAFELHLAILRGDPTEADPNFDELIRHAPPMPLVKIARPLLHAIQGRRDEASAEFDEFRHLPATFPIGVRWMGTIVHVALAAELLRDAEVAAELHSVLAPVAHYYTGDGSGAVFNHGAMARLAGEMALLAGRTDDAITHLRDAVAMNARIGARPYAALSRFGLARALATTPPSSSRLAEAAELATYAAAEFRRLDMPGPLAAAGALGDAIAAARRPASTLSAREAEVAELVAEALSNRQIAERLVLSERTVETHVRSILNKLGVRTRTEIATWVLRAAP